MSDDPGFRTPEEELGRLQEDIAQIMSAVRDIVSQLRQIERHARRAFRAPAKVNPPARRSQGKPSSSPTLSPAAAFELFDDLTDTYRTNGPEVVHRRLMALGPPDLKAVAAELGLPTSKMSKKKLAEKVIGRVKESVMLSKNVNVTPPRSGSA